LPEWAALRLAEFLEARCREGLALAAHLREAGEAARRRERISGYACVIRGRERAAALLASRGLSAEALTEVRDSEGKWKR